MIGDAASEPVREPDPAVPPARRRLTWGGAAWLLVLVAIGAVQVVRGQWVDAAIFGVAAVVLAADAAGLFPIGRPRARPRARALVGAGVVVALALSLAPRHGALAAITILTAGAVAMVIAWPPAPASARSARWPKALRSLAISWAVIWIAGCLWELLQFILGAVAPGGRVQHPALSDLLDPLAAPGIGQALSAVVWVTIGVFLVARGGRR